MKNCTFIVTFAALLFLQSCNSKQHPISFYHSRTGFALSGKEKQFLEETAPNTKVYIRAFDLFWNAATLEEEQLAYMKIKPDSLKFIDEAVLTVFIDNHIFEKIQKRDVIFLAARTALLLQRTRAQFETSTNIILNEVQIDCDWTAETSERYFRFLNYMRTETERFNYNKLSATVRLNQIVNQAKFGVPPVDEAVLTFYNLSEKSEDYVWNLQDSDKYKKALETYSLHLDVLFPIFGWGIQQRQEKSLSIINSLSEELIEASACCQKISENQYEAIQTMYLNQTYLYTGDQIALHQVTQEKTEQAAAWLADNMPTDTYRVIYYNLDNKILENYSFEDLQKIARIH